MNAAEWKSFLELYSQELLVTKDDRIKIPPEAIATRWMGFPPATEDSIQLAEKRLGRKLPPSLRTFYSVSNGWRETGFFIWDVLPVEEIGWVREREPLLYDLACEAENMLGPIKKDPLGLRLKEYKNEQGTRVKRALVINRRGDSANWLLDPGNEIHEKEWPGGRWAAWNPAMDWTDASFEDLIIHEFESFIQLRDNRNLDRDNSE